MLRFKTPEGKTICRKADSPIRMEGFKERVFVEPVEFRPPLKGEYYISGAIPMAYRAPNDLSIAYGVVRPTHLTLQTRRATLQTRRATLHCKPDGQLCKLLATNGFLLITVCF